MPRSKGRAGRPWRRIRAQVLAESSVCWLCGKWIDQTLPPQHPMSATVDHVIPISRGGPELDPSLLRPAHRSCNSRKGNRPEAKPSRNSRQWY
ncbi:HNH endonuclease [Microbispora bryophytorum]|uniref:HNH endonuclease n=1 Tax=Microbispora bryophytorum TaxID=1460882 RepID=UPI0033C7923B